MQRSQPITTLIAVAILFMAQLGGCSAKPMSTTTMSFRDSQLIVEQYADASPKITIGLTGQTPRTIEDLNADASQGDALAHRLLGNAYWQGSNSSINGVNPFPQNRANALWYFERGAQLGDVPSGYYAGVCYELGAGVETDAKRALTYYQKAANAGFPPAHADIGVFAIEGTAMERDTSLAAKHLKIAADAGINSAQFNLALLLEVGDGVDANPKAAADWFLIAANDGHARAMVKLASLLISGKGIEKDELAARAWLELALDAGEDSAQAHLDQLAG